MRLKLIDESAHSFPKYSFSGFLPCRTSFEGPLDCKEIQLVNSKGNQSWIFIRRNDVEVQAPIIWPPDAKSRLIRKDPDAGKDWGQEENGMKEDEMAGWHHWLDGYEFEQAREDGKGPGSLACCIPLDLKELVMTEQLNTHTHTHTHTQCRKGWEFRFSYFFFMGGKIFGCIIRIPIVPSQCLW